MAIIKINDCAIVFHFRLLIFLSHSIFYNFVLKTFKNIYNVPTARYGATTCKAFYLLKKSSSLNIRNLYYISCILQVESQECPFSGFLYLKKSTYGNSGLSRWNRKILVTLQKVSKISSSLYFFKDIPYVYP